jgi:hypothetical protein
METSAVVRIEIDPIKKRQAIENYCIFYPRLRRRRKHA